jgi:hypothetical protein
MIARGRLNREGCNQIFRKVEEMTQSLLDCKVLIDLVDAKCKLQPAEIEAFASELRPYPWPQGSKIALVSAAESEQHDQLSMLSSCLSARSFKIATFSDSKIAVDWLADRT